MTLFVEGLEKHYRDQALFNPINISLGRGMGLGVYGQNGSGKTTFLDIIAGLTRQSAGTAKYKGTLTYVMQRPSFQESLSFKDNLATEAYLYGYRGAAAKARIEECAQRCGLTTFWKKRYARGSAGMRGRLGVAAALIPGPDIILLDEVFNFLDIESVAQIKQVLLSEKQRGMSIVMVSHSRDDFLGLCQQVLMLPDASTQGVEVPNTSTSGTA